MSRRFEPRRLGEALGRVVEESAPPTLLAAVQVSWGAACGAHVAERATPVRERDGVVFVACSSAIWAQELDLIQAEIRSRLNRLLGSERVKALRFSADGPRHEGRLRA